MLNFDLDGNYAYIASGSGGLKIVDVSDPSNPTQVALHDDYTDGCCVGIHSMRMQLGMIMPQD